MDILKNIVKFILYIIRLCIFLLIIISICCLFQRYILNREYATIFGFTFFQIRTGSMSKTIEINDIIIVEITKDVEVDDIITFITDDQIITHRVISENGNLLTTKGDANNTKDKPIERKQVIGKVVKIFHQIGIWIKVFADWKVLICITVTGTFIIMILSTKKNNTKEKKRHSLKKGLQNWRNYMSKNKEK